MTHEIPSTAQRPRHGALILLYSIWIGAIASIALIPELAFLEVVAFVLILLIWLPYWAYRNWSTITEDPAATYATMGVAGIATALLTVYCRWGMDPLISFLANSGIIVNRKTALHTNWIEPLALYLLFAGMHPLWLFLRKRLQVALPPKSGGPGISPASGHGPPLTPNPRAAGHPR